MSTVATGKYRFIATNVLTGAVMADNLPLIVTGMSRAINGSGKLDGYLPLQAGPTNAAFVRALVPDQSMLWCLQRGYPIWGGLFTDSDHQSIKNHQYPITAYTPEAILGARQIRTALTWTNTDIYDIARGIVQYAFSSARGQNAALAGLMIGSSESGILDSLTLGVSNTLVAGGNTYSGTYASNQDCGSALSTFADSDELEYEFAPRLSSGQLQFAFHLGRPAIGRYNSPAINLLHPGVVSDYSRPVRRSSSANDIQGTAAASGSGAVYVSGTGHGLDTADLGQGNILRQTAVQWSGAGITSQAQIDQWTDSQIARFTAGTMVPSVELEGEQIPSLTEIALGDATRFAATSDLDPADPNTGAPGLQVTARITAWNLQPPGPNGQEEKLSLTFGALVGSTGIGGVGIPA